MLKRGEATAYREAGVSLAAAASFPFPCLFPRGAGAASAVPRAEAD